MGLLRKVRVLVGALVHKPFVPRPEKVDLDKESATPQEGETDRDSSALEAQEPEVTDTERVADLIAQRQRDEEDIVSDNF
jgi:hypothetical protein